VSPKSANIANCFSSPASAAALIDFCTASASASINLVSLSNPNIDFRDSHANAVLLASDWNVDSSSLSFSSCMKVPS
jgi:hypothetical protein